MTASSGRSGNRNNQCTYERNFQSECMRETRKEVIRDIVSTIMASLPCIN